MSYKSHRSQRSGKINPFGFPGAFYMICFISVNLAEASGTSSATYYTSLGIHEDKIITVTE